MPTAPVPNSLGVASVDRPTPLVPSSGTLAQQDVGSESGGSIIMHLNQKRGKRNTGEVARGR